MSDKLRLFWAVNLTGELKKKIASFSRELAVPGLKAGWVAGDNLHLTLAFLGDTEPGLIGPMEAAVNNNIQGFAPFELCFGSPGFFPATGSPRVLWLGIRGEVGKLKILQLKVQSALTNVGFVPESRPFSPHLTLARIKSPVGTEALQARVKSMAHMSIEGSLSVGAVELMQSRLGPGGPVYNPLVRVAL